jgi:hypothetical protein
MSFIWGRFKTRAGLSQAMEQDVDKEISSSLATEPKDMVYALLGLASDGTEFLPLPDYKQPPISPFTKLHLLR